MNTTHVHPCYKHQRQAVSWARSVLDNPDSFVILDTESTGINQDDELVQLSIIGLDGKPIYSNYFNPVFKKMHPDAQKAHGLSLSFLTQFPSFYSCCNEIKQAIGRRMIISYNADFDYRMIRHTRRLSCTFLEYFIPYLPRYNFVCAMHYYAMFYGDYSDFHKNYTWQKLPNSSHNALGDCQAVLNLIEKMAATKRLKYWYEVFVSE